MSKFKSVVFIFRDAAEKGFLLMVSAVMAIVIANHNDSLVVYEAFFSMPIDIGYLTLSIRNWINECLMAVFFLLVGMEIKRELLTGHLSDSKQRLLPVAAACSGVIFPVIIYSIFNFNDSVSIKGWAIPAATDIAFAIGVLSIFGKKLPTSLRVFLTALAIIDDLIAICIIGIFYTSSLNIIYIISAAFLTMILALYSRSRFYSMSIALLIGFFIWNCILLSGIHATISGVIVGLLIPMRSSKGDAPLLKLERKIYPITTYIILPLFAFANSGLHIPHFELNTVFNNITLGIALGLFIGKQCGVMISLFILKLLKLLVIPKDATLKQLYGVSILCGIGFTMSLFISIMSFEMDVRVLNQAQLGVFLGSLLSALVGALVLKLARDV